MNFLRDRAVLLHGMGVLLLLLVFSPGRLLSWDVSVRQSISRSLWHDGTVFVDKDHHRAEGMVPVPGRGYTSFYGIGQTLALIPFDMVGFALRALAGWDTTRGEVLDQLPVVWLYIPLMGLLFWGLCVRCLALLGVEPRRGIWVASLFMGSTILWLYACQSAQEEMLVANLLLASVVMMLQWGKNPTTRGAFLCGLFAGLAPLVRLNSALGLIVLGGLFYPILREQWDHPKTKASLAWGFGGGLVSLFLFCGFAYWRFGSLTATGYDQTGTDHMGVIWGAVNPSVLAGVLVGPGKGLFPLSPTLLIAAIGAWVVARKAPAWGVALLLTFVISTVVISRITNNPDGSESWGSRYQVHLLPFLLYPFWEGLRLCARSVPGRVFAGALLVVGIFIQICSTLLPNSIEYIQSDVEGYHRYNLIYGANKGHLGRRIANVVGGGEFIPPGTPESRRESLEYMRSAYFPNHWGPSYTKKTGSPLPLILWGLMGISALYLLFKSYKGGSSSLPQGGKFL